MQLATPASATPARQQDSCLAQTDAVLAGAGVAGVACAGVCGAGVASCIFPDADDAPRGS